MEGLVPRQSCGRWSLAPAVGALIVADDINLPSLSDYLEYVRDPANGYVSIAFPVGDGMEISCWTANGLSDEKDAL
jgi:hypothetical protein